MDNNGSMTVLQTQQVTATDRDRGQIRVPSRSKEVFPGGPATVRLVLRGRAVDARWNPRMGPDRERSGTLLVGREVLQELVPVGTILIVEDVVGGTLELR